MGHYSEVEHRGGVAQLKARVHVVLGDMRASWVSCGDQLERSCLEPCMYVCYVMLCYAVLCHVML